MRSAACITAFSIKIFAATGSIPAYAQDGPPPNPHVVIETTMGDITGMYFWSCCYPGGSLIAGACCHTSDPLI